MGVAASVTHGDVVGTRPRTSELATTARRASSSTASSYSIRHLGTRCCRPSGRRTAVTDDNRCRRRTARRRAPSFTPLVIVALIVALVAAAAIAATVGAAGIPLRRLPAALGLVQGDDAALTARDQLVLWSVRLPHRARRDDRRAARGRRHRDAGPVPQSARRSDAGRHLARRRLRLGARHRGRRPHVASVPFEVLPVAAIAGALVTTIILYRPRPAPAAPRSRPCCSPASRSVRSPTRGSLSGFPRRRPAAARHHVLAARLARRRHVGEGRGDRPFVALLLGGLPFIARGLDPIVLGEAEAFHMGVAVERLSASRSCWSRPRPAPPSRSPA